MSLIPAAEIIQRLYRGFAGGDSARSMAAKLNEKGVDTPAVYYFKQTGKRATKQNSCSEWGSATIMQLLKNQVYIGDMVQCKRKVSSFKTKKRLVTNPEGWVVVENTHEAIIDKPTWERVQRRIATTKRGPSNHSIKRNSTCEVNLFAGIIRCADCGGVMAFNRKVRRGGGEKQFYRCSLYANNGKHACTMHTIDKEVLESVILADIQHHAEMAVHDAQEKALRDAKNRIVFVQEACKRLFEKNVAGTMPDSIFQKMMADYETELAELESTTAELQNAIYEAEDSEANVQQWLALIKECADLTELDRPTAFQLIEQVSVYEREDEIGLQSVTIRVKYNFVGYLN